LEGWIRLHRQIQKGWLWEDKPFSRGQAWIDMLLNANHKDRTIPFDGSLYEVKRGSYITSIRKLCERWGWSNTKVVKFLNLCVNEKMITYFSDKKKTVISIANYDTYQNNNITETTLKLHRNDTETALKHTNNNDNNNLYSFIYNKDPSEDTSSPGYKKLEALSKEIFG
jgi:DNA replication protein DnaD